MKFGLKFSLVFTLGLILIVVQSAACPAADTLLPRYHKSFGAGLDYGNVIHSHDFVKGNNPMHMPYKHYMAFSLEYGIETNGRKLYQQLWGYPSWGFGFYKIFIFNDSVLGSPFAAYTFFDAPFKRWKKYSVNYKIGIGLSYDWTRHSLNDGYDYPIGSSMTVYFEMGVLGNVHLTENLDLNAELVLTHFSNGSIQLPNLGINFRAFNIGVKYIFQKRPEYIRQYVPVFEKEWEALLAFSPAVKQVNFKYEDNNKELKNVAFNYAILNLSAALNRQISYKTKIGAGVDFSFNESYGAKAVMTNGDLSKAPFLAADKFLIGVFPSVEFLINRVSLMLQPGVYVYKKNIENTELPNTYQRVGLKYTFKNNLFTGVNIRAFNFYKADFIEWNIGYRLTWGRKH